MIPSHSQSSCPVPPPAGPSVSSQSSVCASGHSQAKAEIDSTDIAQGIQKELETINGQLKVENMRLRHELLLALHRIRVLETRQLDREDYGR